MVDVFYIGLSCLLKNDAEPCPLGLSAQSREGRRILELLDRRARETGQGRGASSAIAVDVGGRPYYRDGHADFNISHSGGMAAVSYLAVPGTRSRTGCDIQRLAQGGGRQAVAERYFHPLERENLAALSGEEERSLGFYRLWVLKESFLKLRGLSVFDMIKAPLFEFNKAGAPGEYRYAGNGPEGSGCAVFFLYEAGEYVLAVCREPAEGEAADLFPLPCWFSPGPPLRRVAKIQSRLVSGSKTEKV